MTFLDPGATPPEIPERFGRFRILRRLFGDELSVSYHAEDDGSPVLLKIMGAELSSRSWYREYFVESADLARMVEHTNVLDALASGFTEGRCWQVWSFVDGVTVGQILNELDRRQLMLPPHYAVFIALQASRALEHLHGLKGSGEQPSRVVHHDITPDTLYLGFDGSVQLIDAGMVRARDVGLPDRAATQIGRPGYFPPERIKGSEPSPRSDVYAIGVVLWELLAGRRLFVGQEREEIMADVLVGKVLPPSAHNPEVSEELDTIVLKAINRRVPRRYASALTFTRALKTLLGENRPRTLKAGLSEIMVTLFNEEEAVADEALPDEGRPETEDSPADESEASPPPPPPDREPYRPYETRPVITEPWVRASAGPSVAIKTVLGLAALLAVASLIVVVGWTVQGLGDKQAEVGNGSEVVEALRELHPGATNAEGLHTRKGWEELYRGTPDAVQVARAELELAVAADPFDPEALAGLALAYAMLGDPQLQLDAAGLISRAEELSGGEDSVLRAKAGIALASGNIQSAEQRAVTCLRELSNDALCSWYLGEAYLARGLYSEGRDRLEIALESITLSPDLHRSLGEAAMLSGDFVGAEAALGKAVELLPDQTSIHIALADLYRRTGHWDEALASIERVLEEDSRHVRARYLKGVILLHVLGDADGASEILGALAEDPMVTGSSLALDAMVQAAFACLARDRAQEALRYAELALERDDDHAMARLAKAMALDALGDPSGSEEALRGADMDSLEAREAARWNYYAALLYTRHDRQHFARLCLEDALAADPLWVPPRLLLAIVLMRMGEGEVGLRELEETWKLDLAVEAGRDPVLLAPVGLMESSEMWSAIDELVPDVLANKRPRARIDGMLGVHDCVGTGDCREARISLALSLAEDPDDTAVRVFLAYTQMEAGELDEAISNLRYLADARAPSTVHAMLGSCYSQKGIFEEARLAFDAAEARPDRTPALQRRRAQLEMAAEEDGQATIYAREALALDPDDLVAASILLEAGRK